MTPRLPKHWILEKGFRVCLCTFLFILLLKYFNTTASNSSSKCDPNIVHVDISDLNENDPRYVRFKMLNFIRNLWFRLVVLYQIIFSNKNFGMTDWLIGFGNIFDKIILLPHPLRIFLTIWIIRKHDFSQIGQSKMVSRLLDNMTNGFFVECGAYDGETFSNSLLLERNFNWSGLLIEPSRNNFLKMKTKNRKAWLINCCLEVMYFRTKYLDFSTNIVCYLGVKSLAQNVILIWRLIWYTTKGA